MVLEVFADLNNSTVDGTYYPRLAMIQCVLLPDFDGVWRVRQLHSELRQVV